MTARGGTSWGLKYKARGISMACPFWLIAGIGAESDHFNKSMLPGLILVMARSFSYQTIILFIINGFQSVIDEQKSG